MNKYLLADIGSTFTKVCLADAGNCEIIAAASSPTTVETDVRDGFNKAKEKIKKHLTGIKETFVCSSAAGGLKIAAIGLVKELTSEAAKQAGLGAGGKVIKTFSYALTRDDLDNIESVRPDLLLLTGGIDGGNTEYIIQNALKISENIKRIPVIVAGNRSAYDEIKEVFKERPDVYFTDNVMPDFKRLNLNPARELIRKVFLERIIKAKGIDRIQSGAKVLMPTPVAVFKAGFLLSKEFEGLMIADMGGATTDIYSFAENCPFSASTVLKGIPETYEKRSVEADIGVRHNIKLIIENLKPVIAGLVKKNKLKLPDIFSYADKVSKKTDYIAKTKTEIAIETLLAKEGLRLAATRHCGKIEETYTPEGKVYLQEGKNLANIKWVVGSGGAIIYAKDPKEILSGVKKEKNSLSLNPVKPSFLLDQKYILWACGLLSEAEKDAALKIMKKNLRRLS